MRSILKNTSRQVVIAISLLVFVALAGLSLPTRSATLQADPSPTPTPTQVYANGEPVLPSGDTEGLILGAGVILIIIVGGVAIQRLTLNKNSRKSP